MAAGKGYNHLFTGLEYPRAGRLEMDGDPEGQSRGYDITSLQTVPCHIAGMLILSYWKRKNVSNSQIVLQDMWVKDFIHIALVCKQGLNYYAN